MIRKRTLFAALETIKGRVEAYERLKVIFTHFSGNSSYGQRRECGLTGTGIAYRIITVIVLLFEVFMLNVQIAYSLIGIITFILAYAISATVTGCFVSWFTYKMGDDTAVEEGFYTLNPLVHVDIIGTLFLMLYGFGWGRYIPINPFNMRGRFAWLKTGAAFLAEPVAYLMLGWSALIMLSVIFGDSILTTIISFAHSSPDTSSYVLSIGFILSSMVYLNMLLAVITFLINMCGLAWMFFVERHPGWTIYTSLVMLLVPALLYFTVGWLLIDSVFFVVRKMALFLMACVHFFK